ncbi:hypothetical protein QBC35DRAFT_493903 [Podospora australis]|uniref:Uncharacterized protein n=1 Tax=Podospora australis TaxID=1536484 RepID=A0AAN6X099_9PEZI|nr:hypothetical protein QBC35DRAFT_493903 [Podospora australis]
MAPITTLPDLECSRDPIDVLYKVVEAKSAREKLEIAFDKNQENRDLMNEARTKYAGFWNVTLTEAVAEAQASTDEARMFGDASIRIRKRISSMGNNPDPVLVEEYANLRQHFHRSLNHGEVCVEVALIPLWLADEKRVDRSRHVLEEMPTYDQMHEWTIKATAGPITHAEAAEILQRADRVREMCGALTVRVEEENALMERLINLLDDQERDPGTLLVYIGMSRSDVGVSYLWE